MVEEKGERVRGRERMKIIAHTFIYVSVSKLLAIQGCIANFNFISM